MDPQARIAAIEIEIAKKYGPMATQNPERWWTAEDEVAYMKTKGDAVPEKYKKSIKERRDGFLATRRLLHKADNSPERTCPVCSTFSFASNDDVYMSKFGTCFRCYVAYIEGREERWESGWRPSDTRKVSNED